MKRTTFAMIVAVTFFAPPARTQETAKGVSTEDVVATQIQLRDQMRALLKQGVDLSTSQARQQLLYEPILSKLPPALKQPFEAFLSNRDDVLAEAAKPGKFDIADRFFESLAESVKISNALNKPTLNENLNDQAEMARKKMCEIYPDACSEDLIELDPASFGFAGARLACAPRGVSAGDVLCNPNLTYRLYCSISGAPITATQNHSNGALEIVCRGRNSYTIVGAWNKFPPHFKPVIEMHNNVQTLVGWPFSGPCVPKTTEKCNPVDNFLQNLFKK